MNNTKTFILLAGLTALFIVIGGLLGGRAGIMLALLFAAIMNLGSYWYSDKIVLKMFDAKEISAGDQFGLYEIVQNSSTTR